MDLESRIQSYITSVDLKLQNTESIKEKILLFSDVKNIVRIIWDNYLHNKIPDSFINCLNEGTPITDCLLEYTSSLFWKNYRSMYSTNSSICNLTSLLPSSYRRQPLFRRMFSFKRALDITEQFFLSYDKDIYDYFLFLRNNKFIYRTSLNDERSYGLTLSFSFSNTSFIVIDKYTSDINLLMTIAHEVIHSYVFHLIPNISYNESLMMKVNGLDEVYSYFIEFAFVDYLGDCFNFPNTLRIVKNSHFNCLLSTLNNFKNVFSSFDCVSYDYNMVDYLSKEAVVYGILLAYHYFDNYLSDPEKTKDDILSLIIDSKDYDRHFLLNHYGISESELGNPKVITKTYN